VKRATLEKRQEWVLEELLPGMEKCRSRFRSVPRQDGRLLRDFVVNKGLHNGLELGSANGYSAIWIGLGMEKTGGRLTTVEIDPECIGRCRENILRAGLEGIVRCVRGDAKKVVAELPGPFDFVFIDLGPLDVLPFVNAVEPKLAGGAYIALHNLGFKRSYHPFLKYARERGWSVQEMNGRAGGLGLYIVGPLSESR
jgi:predicted O-methyltransferase YrrM